MKGLGWFVLGLMGVQGMWMMQQKADGQKDADRGYRGLDVEPRRDPDVLDAEQMPQQNFDGQAGH